MIRVCPHSDSRCPNGMDCTFSCSTSEYDGTKRPAAFSQTPEAAGLSGWLIEDGKEWVWSGKRFAAVGALTEGLRVFTLSNLVTAASAQAAIDAEKAKVAELERQLVGMTEASIATYEAERDRRITAEARADRLAKALERQADNMAFVLNHASVGNWYDKFTTELAEDRAALQQETQP